MTSAAETALDPVDCAVIVVTYNSAADVGGLLDSLPAAAGGLTLRVIVVDNGSVDRTIEEVRSRRDILCIEVGANLGYAGAINVGRQYTAPCSSVLVLNADLRIAPNAIRELQVALDDPAVGVAVPALTDHQGELLWSVRREPSVLRALGDALLGAHLPQRPGALGEIDRNASAYDHPHAIDWATGAALLISDACDERVGRWDDTRFFLYSEETDFAARARCEGYRVEFVPAARVEHGEGGSGRSPASGALLAINRVRYYEKHHGRLASAAFRAVVVLHELLRAVDPAHRRALRTVVYRARWAQVDAEVRSGCSSELPVSRIRQPSKHLISMSASSTPRAPTEGRRPTTPRELQ